VDVESAGRVLKNPDAINALLRWKPQEFEQFGAELVLRAENDAKALTALDKLTKLDINSNDPAIRAEVNRLIQEIAENSTQGGGERFVLGNWVSHGDGYVADARVNGGIWYESHPDIYKNLEVAYGKNDPRINEALWQINQAALQKQIEQDLPFKYTLSGVNPDKLSNEMNAIQSIWNGANETDILKALDDGDRVNIPSRMKELEELYKANYELSYDAATNSYILIKP
jgi:hypothetical protein